MAAPSADKLLQNNELVFHLTELGDLKQSMSEATFKNAEGKFFRKTISKHFWPKNGNVFTKFKLPSLVKALQRYIGFVSVHSRIISRLAEKIIPLYFWLQRDTKVQLTQAHNDHHIDVNEDLAKAAKLLFH